MFDAVRNNKRIVQIFLLLITLPFLFFGVESYMQSGGGGSNVAKVGGSSITPQEFAQSVNEQGERLRAMYGPQFDPAMLESPEARQAVLDTVVSQRLLQQQANKLHLMTSDDQLRQFLGAIPALQEDGKFSMKKYELALSNQGKSQPVFEAKLRQDLTIQQLVSAVGESAIVSQAATNRVLAVQLEEREASEVVIRPELFVNQVKLGPEAAKAFYDKNQKLFEVPAKIRAEYVVLSADALAEQAAVSEEEIKAAYDKNVKTYVQPEERRASHILIQVSKSAPDAAKQAAREKIDAILAQVKKSPPDFAKIAKEYSQDSGTASRGGDLGILSRDPKSNEKTLADAAYALKPNQLSEVVTSDYGFHIVKVTEVRAEKGRALNEVHAEIAKELKGQLVMKKYAEAAESFTNIVYEQADSLKPAADKYKLEIKQTALFDKTNRAAAGPLAANEKLIASLFSDDSLKNKRNTEAVEVAPNTLVAARVIEQKPAELRAFESLKSDIEKMLTAEEATKLAQKDGEAKLAQLMKGEAVAGLTWGAAQTLTRQGSPSMSPEGLKAVFKAPSAKLPAYVGVQLPKGAYALYRVSQVKAGVANENDPRVKGLRPQLVKFSGGEDFNAYLAALRERFKVTINTAALETKQGQ